MLRDAPRADPQLEKTYATLKSILAGRHADGREAYTAAKGDFVATVLERGGMGRRPAP